MSNRSGIEWTEVTWNPTTGCDQVSIGCDNCYALSFAKRLKAMGQPKYQNDGDPRTSGPGFGLTLHPDVLEEPHRWRAPRLVFVNSMSDLFHPEVPFSFIQKVFTVMAETPQHTYQILTKRSKRLVSVGPELDWSQNVWMGVSVETSRYAFRLDHLRTVPARSPVRQCRTSTGSSSGSGSLGHPLVDRRWRKWPRRETYGRSMGSRLA